MTIHSCPRCGYFTDKKSHIRDHYNRKKICQPILKDLSIEECIQNLNNKKKATVNQIKKFQLKEKEQESLIKEKEKIIQEQALEIIKLKKQLTGENDTDTEDEYIYLLQEREFVKSGENVYKIGRTKNFRNRMGDYPKGSKVICVDTTSNSIETEKELLVIFNDNFINREDIGKEYFQGCKNLMKELIKQGTT